MRLNSDIRPAASQALAKALAYMDCGKATEADQWLVRLQEILAEARRQCTTSK